MQRETQLPSACWDGEAGRWKSSRPTGGQSGGNMAYVRMPEHLNGGTLLAHELGHYFDNPHTFREGKDYNPVDEAAARARMQAWAAAHPGDDPREAFNGAAFGDGAGKCFIAGVVSYDGGATAGFGDGLSAVPIRTLWDAPT